MKEAKKRVLFDNYDAFAYRDEAIESLQENGVSSPSEQQIWDEVDEMLSLQWDFLKEDLQKFFDKTDGTAWIAVGTVGRWDGTRAAGVIFDEFNDFFYRATKDCDYWSFYDINGHLYLECSHHDGDNQFEIRRITKTGMRYYRNWECNWNDKRSKQYIHQKIMEKYSVLPHFAHTIFDYPKQEFIKIA